MPLASSLGPSSSSSRITAPSSVLTTPGPAPAHGYPENESMKEEQHHILSTHILSLWLTSDLPRQRWVCLSLLHGGGLVTKLCLTLVTPWTIAHQAPLSTEFSKAKMLRVGCHFLLQGIFPTQESNPGIKPRSPAL